MLIFFGFVVYFVTYILTVKKDVHRYAVNEAKISVVKFFLMNIPVTLDKRIEFICEYLDKNKDMYVILLPLIKKLVFKYRKKQERKANATNAWQINSLYFSTFFRSLVVILIAIFSFFLILYDVPEILFGFIYQGSLSYKDTEAALITAQRVTSLNQFTGVLFAGFFAFSIWVFRDLNHRREQEISHRETMFSEYKQLVEWATKTPDDEKIVSDNSHGLEEVDVDSKYQLKKGSVLQTAAIYQLGPFVKDGHAILYQRATLETLRAICNSYDQWGDWYSEYSNFIIKKSDKKPKDIKKNNVITAIQSVLRENTILFYNSHFMASNFSLENVNLSYLFLPRINFANGRLLKSSFKKSFIVFSSFRGAKLFQSDFSYTVGYGTIFTNSLLHGSNFGNAKLIGASFYKAKMVCTDFSNACLNNANFNDAIFIINSSGKIPVYDRKTTWKNTIVNEPNLEEDDAKKSFFIDLIKLGAISIADPKCLEVNSVVKERVELYISLHIFYVELLKKRKLQATLVEDLCSNNLSIPS